MLLAKRVEILHSSVKYDVEHEDLTSLHSALHILRKRPLLLHFFHLVGFAATLLIYEVGLHMQVIGKK